MEKNRNLLYDSLIDYFNIDIRKLKKINVNEDFITLYKTVISYLDNLSDEELNKFQHKKTEAKVSTKISLTNEEIIELSDANINSLLQNDKIQRQLLEKIAAVKFNMTPGEISNLSKKEYLIEKIKVCMRNKDTHESIIRIAGKSHLENN
jgi:oligoendopeptidase F